MPVTEQDEHKPAPRPDAPIEEHRRHADEALEDEAYKVPPPDYEDATDEAVP